LEERMHAEWRKKYEHKDVFNIPPFFIDTDMYVMKVWCEFVFQNCHLWILEQIANRKYDGYLLCNIDLPWVPDELREYPDPEPRKKLFAMYKDILINQKLPWYIVSGSFEERFETAKQVLDNYLLKD
jgi:nicotinamide riboside kinase